MADFSKWRRENLEAVAAEMLAALIRARDWIEVDERQNGRISMTGNGVRAAIKRGRAKDSPEIPEGSDRTTKPD